MLSRAQALEDLDVLMAAPDRGWPNDTPGLGLEIGSFA
jgi:hypothetical protein